MSSAPAISRNNQLDQQQLRQIIELQSLIGSAEFNLDVFMRMVVSKVQEYTGATGAVIELLENDDMVYRAACGSAAPFIGLRLKSEGSLSGLCLQTGEVEVCVDTSWDPRVNRNACKRINAASMIVVPLSRNGENVGVLKIISDQVNAFGQNAMYVLKLLAGILGGALGQQLEIRDRQKMEIDLRYMAQSDPLTELPNRLLFDDRLSHALARNARSQQYLALMYIDLDGFKPINDTHGHPVGDELLRAFAARVKGIVRASDTLARLGGDEFALLAEGLHNTEEAALVACKILDAARQEFELTTTTAVISASIGIAMTSGNTNLTAGEFIRRADDALYQAKKAGRDRFAFAS